MKETKADIPEADQIAIVVACAGVALLIMTFLIPKTPKAVGFLLVCLFLFLAYPILHFVRPKVLKVFSVLIAAAMVVYFGKSVWPPLTSNLRVIEANMHHLEPFKPVGLNMRVMNEGTQTIQVNTFDLISITGPVSSEEEEFRTQDEKWEAFKKYVATAKPESSPYLPGDLIWHTITDPRAVLTPEQMMDVETASGAVNVRFMSVMQYTDDTGEHETDYCLAVQKFNVLFYCHNHNGPATPMPHR